MARPMPSDAARFLEALVALVERRADVRAVALVGSYARDAAGPDSDVDVVLLTTDPRTWVEDDAWIDDLPGAKPIATRQWGVLTERRLVLSSGLEIDLGVAGPAWAAVDPLDAGTERVAREGLIALHDPDGLLNRLLEAVGLQRP